VRNLGHAELVGVSAGRERHPRSLDPLGTLLGHALLPDHLAADARGLALELARALVERAHDAVADRDEVPDEVELRLAARGEVDLVRARDLDRAAADLQLDEGRRHGGSIATRYHPALRGGVAERANAAVSKTVIRRSADRGFKSLP